MKTILVTEDNDSNYLLMTYILKNKYNYVRACDGQEAVDMVEKGGIDLVLMDLKMPMMDGVTATGIIKQQHPALPIVAVTANAFDTDREMALKAGCDDFLSKPVSSEVCLRMIEKYIG